MQNHTMSLQKIAYFLIIMCISVYILVIGKNIIVPLAFAGVFALMLKPISDRLEQRISNPNVAIGLSFMVASVPLVGLIWFFSSQFIDVFENLPSISNKIEEGMNSLFVQMNKYLGSTRKESEEMLSEGAAGSFGFLTTGLSVSSSFIVNFFLCLIYTFLLLLYRNSIKQFLLIQFSEERREKTEEILSRIQMVVQKYLYGLLVVIAILGVLNSVGLLLIGIEYAMFWGFLAAFLAVIPYVGTTLGGLLPFLYALTTADSYWQPIAIVVMFGIVQFIEGNIITPLVVGNSIKINPLAAILSLIIGGAIWGVAGLILALPFIAILNIFFKQVDYLKPVSLLLSDSIYEKEDVFEKKFDKERFRFRNLFKKEIKRPVVVTSPKESEGETIIYKVPIATTTLSNQNKK